MYRSFYAGMSYTDLPLFALVLFFCVFLGVTAYVLFFRRNEDYAALARLPLADTGPLSSQAHTLQGESHEQH